MSITFSIGGAVNECTDFLSKTSDIILYGIITCQLISSITDWANALYLLVRPQSSSLMYGYGCRVVIQHTAILKKEYFVLQDSHMYEYIGKTSRAMQLG